MLVVGKGAVGLVLHDARGARDLLGGDARTNAKHCGVTDAQGCCHE